MDLLDDRVPTYDILRILQTFSEIAKNFGPIFQKIEFLLLKWFEQLTIEQITCAACAYSIAGLGSDKFFMVLEKEVLRNFQNLDVISDKEICRGFIYPIRGSNDIFALMLPRIMAKF